MMIDLSPCETDTKNCEGETGTLPLHDSKTGSLPLKGSKNNTSTIKRRHSFNSMMKFLTKKNALYTITEMQSLEDSYSSSFTAGASPSKPKARKTRKGKKKKKKSIVHKSLESALKIMDSRGDNSVYDQPSSGNSLATCSTASLSEEENDLSPKHRKPQAKNIFSKDKKRRAKGEKREAYENIAKNIFSKDEKRRAKEEICAAVKRESRHIRFKDETRKAKKEMCAAVKRESRHIRSNDEKRKAKKELCAAVKREAKYIWSEYEIREAIQEEREADYVLPDAPLLPGSQRWGEQTKSSCDESYMFGRGQQRDEAPVCPVRRE